MSDERDDANDHPLTYAQLDDDAKGFVRDQTWFRDSHFEYVLEDMKYELDRRGLGDLELHYDIGFCQGDGIGFSGSVLATDIEDPAFFPHLILLSTRTEGDELLRFPAPAVNATIILTRAHHQLSPFCFGLEIEFEAAEEEGAPDWQQDDPFESAARDYFERLAQDIYRQGSNAMLDDEEFADYFFAEADDRFSSDGRPV